MALDGVYLHLVKKELESSLIGARVDKIHQPSKDNLIISLRTLNDGNKKLFFSASAGTARVHFTKNELENPKVPPMFCMLLRKYLIGARITALEQPLGERLLILRLDTVDELNCRGEKTLVLELMGKGLNLLLLDGDGHILDCIRRVDYEDPNRRALLPGLFYTLPPQQEKPSFFRTAREACERLLARADRTQPPDKWLLDTFGGLSPLLCRELALGGWERLSAALDALRARIDTGDFTPVMISIDGMPKDYTFQPIYQYGSRAGLTEVSSFSELLDTFYRKKDQQENLRRRSADLMRTAKTARDRLLRKIAAREQELLETEKREEYRRRGDLITANMYRLKRGMRSFEAQDYYEPDCPTVTVPLDERKTPQQNAAYNYKLYNKAKTANRMLTELIAAAREDEAYLESVLDELSRAECDRDLADIRRELVNAGYIKEKTQGKRQKQPAARKPLRFVSNSGTEILVGRGNVQNDELTLHIARRTDLWLHVQKLPGSHVIVSQAEGEADEETIRQAAALAATYSQAKTGGKVAVDCTPVRFVKKPSGAKPGRVIYTDYRTIITAADEALAERLRKD